MSKLFQGVNFNPDLDELLKKRPDMVSLSLTVEKNAIDLQLAKQDLMPQVDVTTEYFKRSERNPNMPLDYLMVMAEVSIPLEFNLGKGNIAAARARQNAAQKRMGLEQQTFKYEVMALQKSLQLRLEQVKQSEIEFSKSKELVESETYKFKTGGGNLFLVNLREEAAASAEASFHETRLAFMDTLLSYEALITTIE